MFEGRTPKVRELNRMSDSRTSCAILCFDRVDRLSQHIYGASLSAAPWPMDGVDDAISGRALADASCDGARERIIAEPILLGVLDRSVTA